MEKPVIEARGVLKRFGSVTALGGLDLEVPAGGIFGLIGPDGAGKTTFMRLLCGLMAADSGRLRVLGLDPAAQPQVLRPQMGYMPQRFSLYPDLTVEENIVFYARLFGVPGTERKSKMERLLAFARLSEFSSRRAGALSGGMKQKLALACSLIHDPLLLVLDEPTRGVDPVSRVEFWRILREVASGGTTVLVSTAYMDEAARCERVCLLARGRSLAAGRPEELIEATPYRVLEAHVGNPVEAAPVIEALPLVRWAFALGDRVRIAVGKDVAVEDAQAAIEAAVAGSRVSVSEPDMEDVFASLSSEAGEAGNGEGDGRA